jgi:hypothetical protein
MTRDWKSVLETGLGNHLFAVTRLWSLVCRGWRLIFADVHGLPFALNDSRADLRWSFSLAGLFVRV